MARLFFQHAVAIDEEDRGFFFGDWDDGLLLLPRGVGEVGVDAGVDGVFVHAVDEVEIVVAVVVEIEKVRAP